MRKQIFAALVCVCLLTVVGTAAVAGFESNEGRLTINSEPTGRMCGCRVSLSGMLRCRRLFRGIR